MHRQMKLKPKIGLKQNITNEKGGRYTYVGAGEGEG